MGRGNTPPQTSPPVGRGTPTPPPHTHGASIIASLALDLWPYQTEILATLLAVCLHCNIRLTVRPNKCL